MRPMRAPEVPTAMGGTRQNPASPSEMTHKSVPDAPGEPKSNAGGSQDASDGSDGRDDIPIGVRVRRKAAAGPAGQPGTIRVVADDGTMHQLEGSAALDALSGFLGKPQTTVWVDLVAP